MVVMEGDIWMVISLFWGLGKRVLVKGEPWEMSLSWVRADERWFTTFYFKLAFLQVTLEEEWERDFEDPV